MHCGESQYSALASKDIVRSFHVKFFTKIEFKSKFFIGIDLNLNIAIDSGSCGPWPVRLLEGIRAQWPDPAAPSGCLGASRSVIKSRREPRDTKEPAGRSSSWRD